MKTTHAQREALRWLAVGAKIHCIQSNYGAEIYHLVRNGLHIKYTGATVVQALLAAGELIPSKKKNWFELKKEA